MLLVALALVPLVTAARWVPEWLTDEQEIADRSDIIVTARALVTKDSGNPTNVLVSGLGGYDVHDRKPLYIPVRTVFEIEAVLKGSETNNLIKLSHYRWNQDLLRNVLISPRMLVTLTNDMYYLLFLVEQEDGVYGPTSGKMDPVYSIESLVAPGFRFRESGR